MRTRFWRQRTNIISATLTLIASLLLTGCLGNDEEDWNGKNISGLMPELEFDLINSQGELVSG
ncbi:electron transport protein SCO1/SenC, partial [Marinobacter manganoxydans MnI7-9]